jgi:hypothetical protein
MDFPCCGIHEAACDYHEGRKCFPFIKFLTMADEFSLANELLTEVVKWGVPLAGGFIAVFFTPLLEGIKLRLNRADVRTKQFEEFSTDLSNFIFHAELVHEFVANRLTTPEALDPVTTDYNDAITTVRKKEFVYLSWAQRYWKESQYRLFVKVLSAVKDVDVAVHAFNDGKMTDDRIASLASKNAMLRDAANRLLLTRPPPQPG